MRHRRCRIVMENRAATGNYAKSHSAAPLHSCYLIKRRSDRKKPFEPSPFSLDTISRPISTSISLCYCSIRDGHCVFIVRTIFLFIFLFTVVLFFSRLFVRRVQQLLQPSGWYLHVARSPEKISAQHRLPPVHVHRSSGRDRRAHVQPVQYSPHRRRVSKKK